MQMPWEIAAARKGRAAPPPTSDPYTIEGPPREPPPQTAPQSATDQNRAAASAYDPARAATDLEAARVKLEQERIALERARQMQAAGPAGEANDGARMAAGFYQRALNAHKGYGQGVAPRDWLTQEVVDLAPEGLVNRMQSPKRRAADTYASDFIAATLRRESGAAIPETELEAQYRRYFPVPGDDEKTAKIKASLRENALEALRTQAGPFLAAPQQPGARLGQEGEDRMHGGPPPLEVDVTDDRRLGETDEQYAARAGGMSFGQSLGNTAAGIAQGIAAIPDAAVSFKGGLDNAIFGGLASGAEALGFDWFANAARHRQGQSIAPTIADQIETNYPTPDAPGAGGARFASSLLGGAASLPRKATDAAVRTIVGDVPRLPPPAPRIPRRQIAADAKRLKIPMLPADAGGPVTRTLTAGLAQTMGGAGPIARGAERVNTAGRKALQDIAGRGGTDATEAGEAATKGALRYRSSSRVEAGRLYDRAAQLAGDTLVTPRSAVQTLDRHIGELGQVPGGSTGLKVLQDLREQIATRFPNGITIDGVRSMRTQLRDRFFSDGLRGSDIERRVNEVVDAAGMDVAASLGQAGKRGAAEAYRVADEAWAARSAMLDEVIMPIIGRKGEKSGEEVFRALEQASRGKGAKLARFVQALPEDEALTVRATVINALGRAGAGRQNAADDAFSFGDFLTNWTKMSPRAKDALFHGESRASIEALARVAEKSKAAARYGNTSNTAGAVGVMAAGAGVFGGLPGLLTVLAGQNISGRLLASPLVARGLSAIGGSRSPGQTRAAIKSLSGAATANPALADDIAQLQSRLLDAFSGSPATSAAAEK